VVEDALTKATLAGGMYYQATEKLSTSLSGLYSTLKDQVNLAFAELGNEMVKAVDIKKLIKDLGEFAGKLTSYFKSLSPETKKFITYAVILGGVLAPVLATIGFMSIGIAALAGIFVFLISPVGLLIAGITALAVAGYLLKDSFMVVFNFLKDEFLLIFDAIGAKIDAAIAKFNSFRTDAASVLSFVGLDSLANSVAPSQVNQAASQNINQQQQLTAGGQMDINIKGLPKGSNSNFTPAPKSFMNIGVNSVYAGG